MEITLTFGLSFSLKHSFQTQLYNHSRRSWLNIADVCFSLFDTISLSDWITLYCLSLLDMNFTRWLIYTPLFFTLLLSKVTKYPGSKEQISRSRLSKHKHCPQGKNSKTHVRVSLPLFMSIKKQPQAEAQTKELFSCMFYWIGIHFLFITCHSRILQCAALFP